MPASFPSRPPRRAVSVVGRLAVAVMASVILLGFGAAPVGAGARSAADRSGPSVTAGAGAVTASGGAIAAGAGHTCALTQAGGVKCWGINDFGTLGNGALFDRLTPTFVSGLTSGVTAVAAGGAYSCALTHAGGVKCWGYNGSGGLGNGSTDQSAVPVDVVGLSSGVAAVAVGGGHSCALTTAGAVKCWGSNSAGQIGDGTTTDRLTPVKVSGLGSGVAAIDVGGYHTCALTTAGAVKCWGDNSFGAVGDGTTVNRSVPTGVVGLSSGVATISTGYWHSCAVTVAGAARCWGSNTSGKLGNGLRANTSTPTDVQGLGSGVARISAGGDHTCAVTTSGALECWGWNFWGQLGDGTTTDRLTPVGVSGLGSDVVQVDAGLHAHTCTLTGSGTVRCWGRNEGRLGDGTTTTRLVPVEVSGSFYGLQCPTLVAPHVIVTLSAGYEIGSVASFGPDPGYRLTGATTATCRPDATWSNPPPVAVAVVRPTVIPGGGVVVEGDAGTVELRIDVTLSEPTTVDVSVPWTTLAGPNPNDLVADPSTDFTPSAGTVTFPAGATTASVSIAVDGDVLVERDEWIVVSFHNPVNARMGGFWGLGFGAILDDD